MRRLLFLVLLLIQAPWALAATTGGLESGAGQYQYQDPATGHAVTVYYYKPNAYSAQTPIVFVLHGLRRNAAEYRDSWADYAEQNNLMVLAPLFERDPYRGAAGYNLGNVFHPTTSLEARGRAKPERLNARPQWAFTLVERLFSDFEANREANNNPRYYLYGHGAGAQFAHRFALFMPEARVEQIIVANSGWYTMPDASIEWPYGTGGVSIVDDALLKSFYAQHMLLLSGGADTATTNTVMRQNRYTNAQGKNRLVRAQNYYAVGQANAAAMNTPFHWQKWTVPGVGHSDDQMAPFAARYIATMAAN
ncbi:hypothetical protein [Salinisphaera aquimarina]|uniref:Alpha/beta hydrolase n=1 Tax=Salinisphaera aquimarina TaxID=2094031 RepID=A0ABV7EI57_9GAMM